MPQDLITLHYVNNLAAPLPAAAQRRLSLFVSPLRLPLETWDAPPADSAGDRRGASWPWWHVPALPAPWECLENLRFSRHLKHSSN